MLDDRQGSRVGGGEAAGGGGGGGGSPRIALPFAGDVIQPPQVVATREASDDQEEWEWEGTNRARARLQKPAEFRGTNRAGQWTASSSRDLGLLRSAGFERQSGGGSARDSRRLRRKPYLVKVFVGCHPAGPSGYK